MLKKSKIMMLGAPGAGKGTQAKKLMDSLGIPHVSTGDMLREARRNNTKLGQEAEKFMNAGQLVPDEVVIGIVAERLQSDDAQNGFILDGFPRTRAQAEALQQMGIELDIVLNIDVSEEEVIKRLGGRISCPNCGTAYHELFQAPKNADICDKCGHQGLVKRADDQPDAIRQRLQSYKQQTEPLIEFYKEQQLLADISGEQSTDKVLKDIEKVLLSN